MESPGIVTARLHISLFLNALLVIMPRAEYLTLDRRIAWEPGIPGGIPARNVSVDVREHGAKADGKTDDHAAFQRAIDALPGGGGVVFIPTGTYVISATIKLKSNTVLRGAGHHASRLRFSIPDGSPCIEAVTYKRGEWIKVTGGMEKGSRAVTVENADRFTAGQFVEIQQDNDPSLMYTDKKWDVSWAENSVGQISVIKDVSGKVLTLNGPLYMTYRSGLNPVIRSQGFIQGAGVERLFITRTRPSADGSTITFKNAAYCWVREVESDHTRKCHISASTIYRCEFRHNYLHHSYDYGGGGHGYGINLGLHTTDCLVEDNIFRHLRHAMLVQVGASGNVFGYNYSCENVQGTGETDLNNGWTPCDISLHGHYPNNNLFESNIVQEVDVADYWGPCGPGNTFLRNRIQSEGLDVLDASHSQNIVGNMLGTGINVISIEKGVTGTLVHGNSVNGAVEWDPAIDDKTIPRSLYLVDKPVFFNARPWPCVGPDIAQDRILPAFERFRRGKYIAPAAKNPTTLKSGIGIARSPVSADGREKRGAAVYFDIQGRTAAGADVAINAYGTYGGGSCRTPLQVLRHRYVRMR